MSSNEIKVGSIIEIDERVSPFKTDQGVFKVVRIEEDGCLICVRVHRRSFKECKYEDYELKRGYGRNVRGYYMSFADLFIIHN